jgi:hypothetical protein
MGSRGRKRFPEQASRSVVKTARPEPRIVRNIQHCRSKERLDGGDGKAIFLPESVACRKCSAIASGGLEGLVNRDCADTPDELGGPTDRERRWRRSFEVAAPRTKMASSRATLFERS